MPHTVLDMGQVNRSLAPAPKEGAPSLAGQMGLRRTHYNATWWRNGQSEVFPKRCLKGSALQWDIMESEVSTALLNPQRNQPQNFLWPAQWSQHSQNIWLCSPPERNPSGSLGLLVTVHTPYHMTVNTSSARSLAIRHFPNHYSH